jgi:hypothetical protein
LHYSSSLFSFAEVVKRYCHSVSPTGDEEFDIKEFFGLLAISCIWNKTWEGWYRMTPN